MVHKKIAQTFRRDTVPEVIKFDIFIIKSQNNCPEIWVTDLAILTLLNNQAKKTIEARAEKQILNTNQKSISDLFSRIFLIAEARDE